MLSLCVHIMKRDNIGEALNSLVNQTLKPRKIVVILDRCTDGTSKVVEMFMGKLPIQAIVKNEKKWVNSIAENIEIAWQHIRSEKDVEYIAIVDADTLLEPDYFDVLIKEMEDDAGCAGGIVRAKCDIIICRLLGIWERTYALSPYRRPRECALLIRRGVLEEKLGSVEGPPSTVDSLVGLGLRSSYIWGGEDLVEALRRRVNVPDGC